MMEIFDEILKSHKVRFFKKQKQRFRSFIKQRFNELGYDNVSEDESKNIIIGDIDNAKYVATAHYDTPPLTFFVTPFTRIFGQIAGSLIASLFLAVVLIAAPLYLNYMYDMPYIHMVFLLPLILIFIIPNPNNANDNTSGVVAVYELAKRLKECEDSSDYAFILFNNEEWGLLGSGAFARAYNEKHNKKADFEVYNLDCVALGDRVLFAAKTSCSASQKLAKAADSCNKAYVQAKSSLFTVASDNLKFDNAVMISTIAKPLIGNYYLPRVHMPYDKKYDEQTINSVIDVVYNAMTTKVLPLA